MGRQLSRAVLAGGVVHPAGTPATPELEEQIPDPAHWTDVPDVVAEPEPAADYAKRTKGELEAEVAERNADRDPDGEDFIQVEAPGNKPQIVAALEADDTRAAD